MIKSTEHNNAQIPRCANCGIAITWQPTVVNETAYCCTGCAHGGPCNCDYEHLPQPGHIGALVLHHRVACVTIHHAECRDIVIKASAS